MFNSFLTSLCESCKPIDAYLDIKVSFRLFMISLDISSWSGTMTCACSCEVSQFRPILLLVSQLSPLEAFAGGSWECKEEVTRNTDPKRRVIGSSGSSVRQCGGFVTFRILVFIGNNSLFFEFFLSCYFLSFCLDHGKDAIVVVSVPVVIRGDAAVYFMPRPLPLFLFDLVWCIVKEMSARYSIRTICLTGSNNSRTPGRSLVAPKYLTFISSTCPSTRNAHEGSRCISPFPLLSFQCITYLYPPPPTSLPSASIMASFPK